MKLRNTMFVFGFKVQASSTTGEENLNICNKQIVENMIHIRIVII